MARPRPRASAASPWLLALAGAGAAACAGGGLPEIVSPRDVPKADGRPSVRAIRDLGDLEDLPSAGRLASLDGDGTFVVGELILVEGSDFGKLPTVLIGGRPATVLARTRGGGIISRVPDGVAPGLVAVEISHPRGKASREIPVHRYGLIAQSDADRIYVFDVERTTATPRPPHVSIPNPRAIRFSADGSMAYVASGVTVTPAPAAGAPPPAGDPAPAPPAAPARGASAKLSVLSMGASGGPRVVQDVPVAFRFVVALAVAERAPLLAVVGETSLQLFSLRDPRHPAPYDAFALPPEVARAGVVAADLDPEGQILAIAVGEGNRLVSVDVRQPEAPTVVTSVDLLPGEHVPLVRDLRFAPGDGTLWVVSGDSAASLAAGKRPTQITAVTLNPGEPGAATPPVLAVWRTSPVPGASAPLRLTVARGQPIASGATVRAPPEKAAVFVTGVDPRILQLGGLDLFQPEGRRRAASLLGTLGEPGMLIRTSVAGGGGPLFSVPSILTSLDLSPDSQIVLAATCRVRVEGDRLGFEFGATTASLWGPVHPTYVKLADMNLDAFRPPFQLGHVRIQP